MGLTDLFSTADIEEARRLRQLPGWKDLRLETILLTTGTVKNCDPKVGARETVSRYLREQGYPGISDAEQARSLHAAISFPRTRGEEQEEEEKS